MLTIWLTGLSGAGKTTISKEIYNILYNIGYNIVILDGDEIRKGLSNDLGFSLKDRNENIRRISEVSKLLNNNNIITVVSVISPMNSDRFMAKEILGDYYKEIYINTPIEICKQRDPKGLYKLVDEGKITNFTGIHSPYEKPSNPFLEINTLDFSAYNSARKILNKLKLL